MATRSPGVYFTESDNTQYSNPKAVTGTVLAVVGYASKGPLEIPTQINSWREFLNIFGKPLSGQYSGLAVKNFLTAGGSVLFYRLADDTASPSNYVVKNPIFAKNGTITFSRTTDILAKEKGYYGGSIYALKASISKSSEEKTWKYFFVRSPEEGRRLTQASVVKQISEQLAATPAMFEGYIKKDVKPGLYGFNVKDESGNLGTTGEYYFETVLNQDKGSIYQSIKYALEYGTNAKVELEFDGNHTWVNETPINVEPIASKDYKSVISGIKTFKIKKGDTENTVSVSMDTEPGETLTLTDIARKIDEKISKTYGIRVFAAEGDTSGKVYGNKLIFVSTKKSTEEAFDILGYSSKESGNVDAQDLFVKQKDLADSAIPFVEGKGEGTTNALYVRKYSSIENSLSTLSSLPKIYFDEITSSIIIKSKETGSTKEISIIDPEYKNEDIKITKNVFEKNYSLKGQDLIDLKVYKDEKTEKVTFESNSIEAPSIEAVGSDKFVGASEANKYFKELLDIEKIPGKIGDTGKDEPITGNPETPASARDMVVFTSKEFGSGTSNIDVEVFTSVNPTDEKDVKHTLVVYVDGVVKETFEDISYVRNSEDYFVNSISKSAENGGSAYILIEDIIKNPEEKEVVMPDGIFPIGRPRTSEDIQKPDDLNISKYDEYNYTIGKDGIPNKDEGYLLFEEALEPDVSKLANKELYDFHILITPDDISEPVQNACIALCENRGDAITIIDPPLGLDKKSVIEWHNAKSGRGTPLNSNYAATYWPWCKVYDTTSGKGKFTWVMPSVIMAAQYARVDKTVGCHMAPAGEVNGVLPVIDIEQYPNPLDRDELYVEYNRINPLAKFKDGTIVAYGEKTTQRKNSVLTKIHTRRMLVQIKKQCREALRGYIFMPNTADYLGKISSNIIAILEGYKTSGGLNFYKVVCDETNNPIEIRQQDIINVDVVLVPEGTIEQINISLTLNKNAETVTD